MTGRRRIVVLGILGRLPFAGVAWQVLHYLEGLRRLGHDVVYVEDTGEWPYDAERNAVTDDCGYTVRYIGRVMARCRLEHRWAYRAASEGGRLFGPSADELGDLFASVDALVNLSGATVLRDEHLKVPVRIYLETDPVLPQIEVAQGVAATITLLEAHTHHFSFGENIGQAGCPVPVTRFAYRPTRQPVVLDWWAEDRRSPAAGEAAFTTVGNWRQRGKDVAWNGELYTWSKHVEFMKVLDLPTRAPHRLELALACDEVDALAGLRAHGWRVVDALPLTRDLDPYRDYIQRSHGEFTVAKDQNVRLRSGWFSDRSACYLAAGKPVITQDTGFDRVVPTGRGLFAFRTLDEAADALDAVACDYDGHRRAAREIAAEYFDAGRVLRRLLDEAGV